MWIVRKYMKLNVFGELNHKKNDCLLYMQSVNLCEYKDMFGKPNTGLRKYRIFDISIMDTVVVLLFGYLFSIYSGYPLLPTLAVLFISGIIIHRLFCVRTRIDRLLFPNI